MFKTVFENEFFIAVDKPSGWLTIPGRVIEKFSFCLHTALEKEKNQKFFVVHRLDEVVSGIVLFAKTSEAHREANIWFENRLVKKKYEALTDYPQDLTLNSHFLWKTNLMKGKRRAYSAEFGKPSITEAIFEGERIFQGEKYGYWSLFPHTGRPHQLRYELSRHAFPIVGDVLYGGGSIEEEKKIFLRALSIQFPESVKESFKLPSIVEVDSFLKE